MFAPKETGLGLEKGGDIGSGSVVVGSEGDKLGWGQCGKPWQKVGRTLPVDDRLGFAIRTRCHLRL